MLKYPIAVRTNGKIYGGWTSVKVKHSIEAVSGSFDVSLSERWSGQPVRWPILPGDAVAVEIHDQAVITGWVDDLNPEFSADSHTVRIAGRDRTGDLVDCSAIHSPDQWNGLKLDALVNELGKPFGVTCRADVDVGAAIAKFKLQQGETAFNAIERAIKLHALLATSDGSGNLVLTRAGESGRAKDGLVLGQNLKSIRPSFTWRDRFSDYIVKGQRSAASDEDGAAAAHVKGEAQDQVVSRYRPLLLVSEGETDGVSAPDRAAWEAAVRAGKATRVECLVQGWAQSDGALWAINQTVSVSAEQAGIVAELLIADREFSIDDSGGTVTRLSCAPATAYLPEPIRDATSDTLITTVQQLHDKDSLKSRKSS